MLWVGYLVTLFLGRFTTLVGIAANFVGLVRKCGMPNFSAPLQFVQQAAFQDEFSNITYLIATVMTSGGLFVSGPIIISAFLFLATEFQKMLRTNPSLPILSMGVLKNYIDKGAGVDTQNYGRQIKADMEVYCGFYLVGMIFLGGANFMGVIMFWQVQRMRYMVSVPLQMGFQRLDQNIMSVCPGALMGPYMSIKGLLQGMTDVQA